MKMVNPNYFGCVSFEEMEAYNKTLAGRTYLHEELVFMGLGRGLYGKVLDVGQRTPTTIAFEKSFGVHIEDTGFADLNWNFSVRSERYDFILCFHVLEHLMNPLSCLVNTMRGLKKGGILYLSTPRRRLVDNLGPFGCHHFQEFTLGQLKRLFDVAELKISRMEQVRVFYPYIGLRSLLKLFSRTAFLIEAQRSIS